MSHTENEVFERALVVVFGTGVGGDHGREGGLANVAADRGGITLLGISLRYLRMRGVRGGGDLDKDGDVDAADILLMTPALARAFYREDFWEPTGAADMAVSFPDLAIKVFEHSLPQGPREAVRALQRALNDLGHAVAVDGSFGEQTFSGVSLVKTMGDLPLLLERLRIRCAEQYVGDLARDKSQLTFAVGWLKRALDLDGRRLWS